MCRNKKSARRGGNLESAHGRPRFPTPPGLARRLRRAGLHPERDYQIHTPEESEPDLSSVLVGNAYSVFHRVGDAGAPHSQSHLDLLPPRNLDPGPMGYDSLS